VISPKGYGRKAALYSGPSNYGPEGPGGKAARRKRRPRGAGPGASRSEQPA